MQKSLKFIDLFAGTGAFTLALEKNNKFKCVFTNDMMECSKKIYELNNPTHTFTLNKVIFNSSTFCITGPLGISSIAE